MNPLFWNRAGVLRSGILGGFRVAFGNTRAEPGVNLAGHVAAAAFATGRERDWSGEFAGSGEFEDCRAT